MTIFMYVFKVKILNFVVIRGIIVSQAHLVHQKIMKKVFKLHIYH